MRTTCWAGFDAGGATFAVELRYHLHMPADSATALLSADSIIPLSSGRDDLAAHQIAASGGPQKLWLAEIGAAR